jgi:hypothetical protein
MKPKLPLALLFLVISILALPTLAQETTEAEPTDEEDTQTRAGYGEIFAELGAWIAQPTGLQYRPGTRINPDDPFDTNTLGILHGTDNRFRYRVGYELHNNVGAFVLTWYAHQDEAGGEWFDPGNFVFGETQVSAAYAGFNDDGLADAVVSRSLTKIRDLRLDFYRTAFENERVTGKWFVGYRRITHQRNLYTSYYAVVPNLPPLIPPLVPSSREDLVPLPDLARSESQYSGRGVEAGIDLEFPVRGKDIWIEAGFAVAVLRGDLDSRYDSTTHFYAIVDSGEIVRVLAPPYSEFEEREIPGDPSSAPLINSIFQQDLPIGLRTTREGANADVMEGYIGVRWRAWRGLEAFAGFRSVRYTDVGADVRPEVVFIGDNDVVNLQTVTTTKHPAGYEGYYVGVSYRY